MAASEAIQTWVVHIQRYHCLSVSVSSLNCRCFAKSRLLNAHIVNELRSLRPKIIHTMFIFLYAVRSLGREVFTNLRFGLRSKKLGSRCSSVYAKTKAARLFYFMPYQVRDLSF